MNGSQSTILLVEDSDEDYVAMRRVMSNGGWEFDLKRSETAEDALDFLRRRGQYLNLNEDLENPSLILLDLNLPGMDGRELLHEIKQDEKLKKIPVVALTTSNNPRDIEECYRRGVNCYQVKPVNFEKFSVAMGRFFTYWLETATLPSSAEILK